MVSFGIIGKSIKYIAMHSCNLHAYKKFDSLIQIGRPIQSGQIIYNTILYCIFNIQFYTIYLGYFPHYSDHRIDIHQLAVYNLKRILSVFVDHHIPFVFIESAQVLEATMVLIFNFVFNLS